MPSDGQDDLVFIKTTSGKTCIVFFYKLHIHQGTSGFSGETNISQSFFPSKKTGRVFLPSCLNPRPPNARWPGVQLWNSSGAAWASKLSTRSSLKRFGFCSHTLQGTNLPYPTKRGFSREIIGSEVPGDFAGGYVVIVLSKRPSLGLGPSSQGLHA